MSLCSMFRLGKYKITMIEGGEEGYLLYEVIAVDGPLIKVRRGDQEHIINTTSRNFVSAEAIE